MEPQTKIKQHLTWSRIHDDIMNGDFIDKLDQDDYLDEILNLTLEAKQHILYIIARKYNGTNKQSGVLKDKFAAQAFFKVLHEKTKKRGVENLFKLPPALVDRNGMVPGNVIAERGDAVPKHSVIISFDTPITDAHQPNLQIYKEKLKLIYTALHRAAEFDFSVNEEVINIILEQGNEVDRYQCRFETPLNIAILSGNLNAFHALVNAGAYLYPEDAEVFNQFIWPPLARVLSHSIPQQKRTEMLGKLLRLGASVNTRCFHGKFPVYFMALNSLNHMSSARLYHELIMFLNSSNIDLTLQTQDVLSDKPKLITILDFVSEESFVIHPSHDEHFETENEKIRKLVKAIICKQIVERLQNIMNLDDAVNLVLSTLTISQSFPRGLSRLIAEYSATEDLTMKYGTSPESIKFLAQLPKQTTLLTHFKQRPSVMFQDISDMVDVVESVSRLGFDETDVSRKPETSKSSKNRLRI